MSSQAFYDFCKLCHHVANYTRWWFPMAVYKLKTWLWIQHSVDFQVDVSDFGRLNTSPFHQREKERVSSRGSTQRCEWVTICVLDKGMWNQKVDTLNTNMTYTNQQRPQIYIDDQLLDKQIYNSLIAGFGTLDYSINSHANQIILKYCQVFMTSGLKPTHHDQ